MNEDPILRRQDLRAMVLEKFGVIFSPANRLVGTADDMFLAMNKTSALGPHNTKNEIVAAFVFAVAYGEFVGIKTLCEDAIGYGASIVLRALLDLFFNFHWILADQTHRRAEKFLFWPWIEKFDEMMKSPFEYSNDEKKKIEHNFETVRQMYTYINRKNKEVVASKWYLPEANSVRDLADQVGLLDHYVSGYRFLSKIVHLDPVYVTNMLVDMKVIQHDPGFHRFILNEALALSFTYFLHICIKINDMFGLGVEKRLENFIDEQKDFPREGNI